MRIVVGITGGIAAYKAVHVARSLVLAGHDVHIVPTRSALRFVGAPTLEAISRNPVTTDVFDDVAEVRHVALGQSADLIVIAPATANSIARLAAGIADDMLGTTVLASSAPLVVAPAMHTEMWSNAATQANVATLVSRGVTIVGPASGQLTGADSGIGRMAEPDDIVAAALAVAAGSALHARDLEGVTVVVSAGGTREPLDPVRFIGNRSSGAQGAAIAEAARDRGASVTLVGANLEVPVPTGVESIEVETTAELQDAMLRLAGADVVVMAAAVADYRPTTLSDAKLKKERLGEQPTIELTQNPDILAELGHRQRDGVLVGFAAETESDVDALVELGRAKIARKGCDLLVVNRVGDGHGFGAVDTAITIIDARGDIVAEASGSKLSVARGILDAVITARREEPR